MLTGHATLWIDTVYTHSSLKWINPNQILLSFCPFYVLPSPPQKKKIFSMFNLILLSVKLWTYKFSMISRWHIYILPLEIYNLCEKLFIRFIKHSLFLIKTSKDYWETTEDLTFVSHICGFSAQTVSIPFWWVYSISKD